MLSQAIDGGKWSA